MKVAKYPFFLLDVCFSCLVNADVSILQGSTESCNTTTEDEDLKGTYSLIANEDRIAGLLAKQLFPMPASVHTKLIDTL